MIGRAARGLQQRGFQISLLLFALCLKKALCEEAEEGPSAADVAIAATLLGAISFIMTLYYFTNYHDTDIQKYSWKIISDTISIFCAVLIFQSFNDLAEAYIIDPLFGPEEASPGALLVDMLHMLLWFCIMQFFLAKLSGALDDDMLQERFEGKEKEKEEFKEGCEINMKCFAVLLAHMTGFASINAFGTVQQFPFFKSSPVMAFTAVFVGLFGQLGLQRITDMIRTKVSKGDDGTVSEWEDLWDDETEEAENDVMGLTLSFLTMNAIRFGITGCLPNQEGKEEECTVEEFLYHHSTVDKWLLLGTAFVFTFLVFLIMFKWPESLSELAEAKEKGELSEEQMEKQANMLLFSRLCEGVFVAVSMCFSWSFFYAVQMVLAGIGFLEGQPELLAVLLALTISLLSFGSLIFLDKLYDSDSSKWPIPIDDAKCDKALTALMCSIALLVGFAWEQCFDQSVDALAEKTNKVPIDIVNQHTTKLFLSLFCSALLVPAWKMYILPYVLKEGWDFGYVLNLVDLVEDDKKEEMKEVIEHVKKAIRECKNLDDAEEGGKGKEKSPKGEDSYKSLPGTADEALKKQNSELKAQLQQYKQMFDQHMGVMTANFKKIDATIGRLEKGVN